MPGAAKERLDQALVRRGLAESREQAKRLILAGEVRVGTEVWDKPSMIAPPDREITVTEKPRFVSRAGLKLEAALDHFGIDPTAKVCFDCGASTGGFTDCLLQRGAARVHAYDVGTNQLAWKLRRDPRVIAREKCNVRHLPPDAVGEPIDLVTLDVSFISLTLILPAVFPLLKPEGDCVCLIKPQFELDREAVGKGGIVRDPADRERAVAKIRAFAEAALAARWMGEMESPLTGADGNQEHLAWIKFR